MPLSDKDAGMMDGLGETSLEDLGLQTALQEVLNLQTENIIELHLLLIQHSNTDQTSEERIAWRRDKLERMPLHRYILCQVGYCISSVYIRINMEFSDKRCQL